VTAGAATFDDKAIDVQEEEYDDDDGKGDYEWLKQRRNQYQFQKCAQVERISGESVMRERGV